MVLAQKITTVYIRIILCFVYPILLLLKAFSSVNVNKMKSQLINLLGQCLFPIEINLQFCYLAGL
jgi:hypothetical protein